MTLQQEEQKQILENVAWVVSIPYKSMKAYCSIDAKKKNWIIRLANNL